MSAPSFSNRLLKRGSILRKHSCRPGVKLMAIGSLISAIAFLSVSSFAQTQIANSTPSDTRLQKAYRFQQGGWTYVHLEGSPSQVGFQHGYLLAPEIADAFAAIKLFDTHQSQQDWEFFRKTAREMLWPHIDSEYQQELQGIADGVKAHGVDLDVYDIVALNAFEEVPDYYLPWKNKQQKTAKAPKLTAPGNCSAFIATGSFTKDHQIVIAHNNWTSYLAGAAGIMITETTITQFEGWDPNGKPEFMRSRKALQYAKSIDDYVRIIKEGNNGGYANDWLIGDRKTGEVAYLELGLKSTPLWRTRDGYFVSSNFARDPKVLREETTFDPNDASSSPNARHNRLEELMKQGKGKIDVEMAQQLLSDHFDSFEKKEQPNERALCGHVDASSRGVKEWAWDAYNPGGAVQGKATDSKMTANMSFVARAGHPCGADFLAEDFLEHHPEYSWQKPLLRDMKAGPWTTFQAGQKGSQ